MKKELERREKNAKHFAKDPPSPRLGPRSVKVFTRSTKKRPISPSEKKDWEAIAAKREEQRQQFLKQFHDNAEYRSLVPSAPIGLTYSYLYRNDRSMPRQTMRIPKPAFTAPQPVPRPEPTHTVVDRSAAETAEASRFKVNSRATSELSAEEADAVQKELSKGMPGALVPVGTLRHFPSRFPSLSSKTKEQIAAEEEEARQQQS